MTKICANVYLAPNGNGYAMGFLNVAKRADAEAKDWARHGWRPLYRINYRLRSA